MTACPLRFLSSIEFGRGVAVRTFTTNLCSGETYSGICTECSLLSDQVNGTLMAQTKSVQRPTEANA